MIFMMFIAFYIFGVPYLVEMAEDPAPGITRSVSDARKIKCRMLSKTDAINTGRFEVEEHEGNDSTQDNYVTCERAIFDPGEREVRDEAVLTALSEQATRIASAAVEHVPNAQKWLVAVHYPVPAVSYKINKAVWTALKERQAVVSADTRFSETAGFPVDAIVAGAVRCDKHFSISQTQTLLDVQLVDANETQLHAGVCHKGAWQWLF